MGETVEKMINASSFLMRRKDDQYVEFPQVRVQVSSVRKKSDIIIIAIIV